MTLPNTPPSEELYRFGADGNLRLYSYDRLFYSLYGYDGGTTRTYKYSFDLNPNWVNGRLEAVNFNPHTAMFYPNSYINFNSNGYYTKHYYNGMERIASRLGDQNLPISTHDPELQDRKEWQDSLIRKNIVEITGYEFLRPGEEPDPDDPKPVFELPQVGITGLQPSADGLYYYHSNHLGSTCYVTDGNASVQQGFLYAPFGEITNEYNAGWQSGVLPKYSFNAKELDEETGMYYYEARYYNPPTFISRDPHFERYPTFSPYTYCANNPVNAIDPDGNDPKSLRKVTITVSGKPINNVYYVAKTYPDESNTCYIVPVYNINVSGIDNNGKEVCQTWQALRFMPFLNENPSKHKIKTGKTPIMAGLTDERKKTIQSYISDYKVHSTVSEEDGAFVIFGNFMIHDGPDDLIDEFCEWGGAGCMGIIGKEGFLNFKKFIFSLSGSDDDINNMDNVLRNLVKDKKLELIIQSATKPKTQVYEDN